MARSASKARLNRMPSSPSMARQQPALALQGGKEVSDPQASSDLPNTPSSAAGGSGL
jgi:hypothetical protein